MDYTVVYKDYFFLFKYAKYPVGILISNTEANPTFNEVRDRNNLIFGRINTGS